jgi:hypothetical protein
LDQVLNENATDAEALNIGLILAAVLTYHILPEGAFTAKQLAGYTSLAPALSYPEEFPAAGNVTLTAPEAASGNVTFSGASNSTATVIVPDIKASPAQGKGQTFIAHIVDGVLLPPANVLANVTALAANATTPAGAGNTTTPAGAGNTTTPAAGNATTAGEGNTTTP